MPRRVSLDRAADVLVRPEAEAGAEGRQRDGAVRVSDSDNNSEESER
jgi:hypothetical protein